MIFRKKLQYFLVKKLLISNKEAAVLIQNRAIKVNQVVVNQNIIIENHDKIEFENTILQIGFSLKYYAYYKPRGIETTMNEAIENNLKSTLKIEGIFPIGRLDKASEGLLILTNDGTIYDKILRKEFEVEKEYIVEVDKIVDETFINNMSGGIEIMGKKTLPCFAQKESDFSFKIILIQGLNRQIRRMTYKLGYEVISLKRIRIGSINIKNLLPNEMNEIDKFDILS